MFGMSKEKMAAMLKQAGIKVETLNAKEVLIKVNDGSIKLSNCSILQLEQAGKKTYIIEGNEERIKEEGIKNEKTEEIEINEDDIDFVMKEANISKEKARELLKKADGDIAKAIMMANENKNK